MAVSIVMAVILSFNMALGFDQEATFIESDTKALESVKQDYIMWVVLTSPRKQAASILKKQYGLSSEDEGMKLIEDSMNYFEKKGEAYLSHDFFNLTYSSRLCMPG